MFDAQKYFIRMKILYKLKRHSSSGKAISIKRNSFLYYSHFTNITYVLLQKIIAMKLFVAGLPYDLDDAELEEIFEKFGTVTSARVAIDRETGKSKGFGFVEMQNDSEAKEAIENLKDISLGKKPLVVTQAEERNSPKPPNRGGGGGGYRGR
jgi:RNA recognition motif-containing protein